MHSPFAQLHPAQRLLVRLAALFFALGGYYLSLSLFATSPDGTLTVSDLALYGPMIGVVLVALVCLGRARDSLREFARQRPDERPIS